jgi:hypothetical protein
MSAKSLAGSRRLCRPIFELERIERRVLLASVSGQFFYDTDGNGALDAGEGGTAGWTVFLDANQNGTFDGTNTTQNSTNVPLAVPPSGHTVGITTSSLPSPASAQSPTSP